MNCCVNCFSDPGLKSRIEGLISKTGNCNFCLAKNIDIVRCEDLSLYFEPLFNLYANHPNAEKSLKINEPVLMGEHLDRYWPNLFNKPAISIEMILHLIDQIGKGYENYSTSLFEEPVELEYLISSDIDLSSDLGLKWDSFSKEIKFENRFFLNEEFDIKPLKPLLRSLGGNYPVDSYFYRARISDELLSIDKLGKPDFRFATAGRANPIGIAYLYVSESVETTVYETRTSLHETISVGRFRVNQPLLVMSLKNIAEYGPFEISDKGLEVDDFIKYRPYLLKLGDELSKPVRKQDSHFDYLPTQFLCEFIKSLGFDAVEYKSAMNPVGYNLAVFNDSKLECVDARFFTVNDLKYDITELT